MRKLTRRTIPEPTNDAQPASRRKAVPYRFVLDAVAELTPTTRAMFGALAVYVGEKIIFILRDHKKDPGANGVWVSTPDEDDPSLSGDFPNARTVHILGKDIKGWRLLPCDAPDFGESVLHACELVNRRDPRIGKVPTGKRSSSRERAG